MNTTLPKKIKILQQKGRDTDTLQSLHANNKKQQGDINIKATIQENEGKSSSVDNAAHPITTIHYSQFPAHTGITLEHIISILGSYKRENIVQKNKNGQSYDNNYEDGQQMK